MYLCSLVISLLLSQPVDYPASCCSPRGQEVGETLREPAAIPQQPLEEVEKDDLAVALRRVVRSAGKRRPQGTPWKQTTFSSKIQQEVFKQVQNDTEPAPSPVYELPKFSLVIHQEYLCHQVEEDDSVASGGGATSKTTPIYLLIIVHSHPGHKRRRNAIRETWGRAVKNYDVTSRQVALVFALGLPRDYDEYRSVQKEARLYRDVIVWDFTDDYRNLTLKSLAGFSWAARHCANATFLMKADDDIYLNVPYLIDVLSAYPTSSLILGSLNSRSPVKRYGQWKVDYRQYPQQRFPPYCSGCAYVISGDMASRLYHVTQTNQSPALIPVEDVFVTGLLAEKVGVSCRHNDQFPTWITVPSVGLVQKYLRSELVGLHGVDWIRMHSMWHMIQKCSNCTRDVQEAKRWLSWVMDKDPMYR